MTIAVEEKRLRSLFERVEVVEDVARTLPKDDERRARLLAVSDSALAEEGTIRPVIAARLLAGNAFCGARFPWSLPCHGNGCIWVQRSKMPARPLASQRLIAFWKQKVKPFVPNELGHCSSTTFRALPGVQSAARVLELRDFLA